MHINGRKSNRIRGTRKKGQASRHRLFAGRLALALIVVATLFAFARSFAQVLPRPGVDNALTQILLDLEDVRIHAERIQILSRYCKPPLEPNKSETQSDIDLESLVYRTLLRDFYKVERAFVAAGTTPTGMSFIASFPVINGIPPAAPTYWPVARGMFTQVQNVLTKKQQQLDAAPERDCGPQQAKQEPVKDSQPPPDPLAGLTRPKPHDITFPMVPAYFCSEFQRRQWYLDNFAPEWNEAADNAADASTYRAEVSRRGAEHANKGGDPAQQRRLDAEERWADKNSAQHARMSELTESIRLMIMHTPIIDCSLLTQRVVGTTGPVLAEVADIQSRIAAIDAKIKKTEGAIASADASLDELRKELDSFDVPFVELGGQEMYDTWQAFDRVKQGQSQDVKELRKLQQERADLQDWLKHDFQLIDNMQKADAGAGTPRVSGEPVQKVEEQKPSWREWIPALIPDISVGGRGGGGAKNPCGGIPVPRR